MKFLKTFLITLIGLLILASVAYAASYISIYSGPEWDQPHTVYSSEICTNTAFGETTCVQYTTDGETLLYGGNNPSFWNGTKAPCVWLNNDETCPDTGDTDACWRCTIPETPNATINYRFYVVNQIAGGNCAADGNVYYGQGTSPGTFNTGPNALDFTSLGGQGFFFLTIFIGTGAVIAGFFIWKHKR